MARSSQRVYVHAEASPGLQPLLDEFAGFVTAWTSSGEDGERKDQDDVAGADAGADAGEDASEERGEGPGQRPPRQGNYWDLMDRQERHVRRSLRHAHRDGLDWLFHVDDDELLHFELPMAAILASAPAR